MAMPSSVCPCQRRSLRVAGLTLLGATIAIVIALYISLSRSEKQTYGSLRLVSVLFRHGDRTPTETFPTDPYKDDKYWPEGWGALTNRGKMELYTLGKYLRKRYNGFISETYYPHEVYVRSSYSDRCLMSAEANLAGLYPPKGAQIWNTELNWQPIPVHATPRNLDQLIVMKKPCPKYKTELENVYNSPEILKLNEENSELLKYLSDNTGHAIENITAVEFLFNTLEIEEKRNLPLPEWTKNKYYPAKLKMLAARSLALFSETTTMKRLNGGPLVKHITQNMVAKSNSTEKLSQKLLLYSVHDITIVNVLQTIGFRKLLKPEYGASLIFELHSKNDIDYEVQMMYLKGALETKPDVLSIPGCTTPCHLREFMHLVEPFLPINWTEECQQLHS